ncbi:response regulator [Paradesertivirga mongoliensis]|uniref:Response regulator n=1 Tax=Paradesertivirga mongoliensis TaxID=2100740 RepID=A0ABW4ZMF6_9SPHI|nr:response regulator [Pedobacter mongoliensis]
MSSSKKVLVIEDDDDILFVTSFILKENGYEVYESRSADVINQLDTINPDLILMDNVIKGVSGSELCKKLKSDPATSHYRIVLISAVFQLPQLAAECLADGYIEKPFDLTDFINKLKVFTMVEPG